jgi:hypothetical protein
MLNRRTIFVLAFVLTLTGCECKSADIKIIQAMHKGDKYASCREIALRTHDAKFYVNQLDRRYNSFPGYIDNNPLCIPKFFSQNFKAEQAAADRVRYLTSLYTAMGCNKYGELEDFDFSGQGRIRNSGEKEENSYYYRPGAKRARVITPTPLEKKKMDQQFRSMTIPNN